LSCAGKPSTETLALADQYDTRGRHDAAIDTLVQGVREGDVEAMTRLGKRLLVGDRAPVFPELISDEVCSWLIERSKPRLVRARVYDSNSGAETVHGTRSNRSANFNLIEADLVHMGG